MKAKEPLYVVIHYDSYNGRPSIGYLPFDIILKNEKSKLFNAVFGKKWVELEYHEYGGLSGIYYDKALAREHMAFEKKFRTGEKNFEIMTIAPLKK